jgi:acyl-CoA thioester hydrolase
VDRLKRATSHGGGEAGAIGSKAGAGAGNIFVWPVRVYYEDTDLGGVVYHANYLRFMERARTEWLRALGFEQDQLRHHHGVQFVVVAAQVEFLRPARFNDELRVSVAIKSRGRASLVFSQDIRLASSGHAHICTAEIRAASVDAASFKPCPLPKRILAELDA